MDCDNVNRVELIRTATDSGNGDSGAPVYDCVQFTNDTVDYSIQIPTQSVTNDCTFTFGTAAYERNNQEGIVFDT